MVALDVSALINQHDTCPKCGRAKRKKNNQCADCRGYGRGRHIMPSGYVRLWMPNHELANSDGYVLEHRYALHEAGLRVPRGWHIHHIDGDKQNNDLDNLVVCRPKAHRRLHHIVDPYVVNQHGRFPLRRVA